MKLHNIALIGLLLGSSAACAGVEKETTSTKNSDTTKFIGYSALALANGGLGLITFFGALRDNLVSESLLDKLWLYFALAPAYLATNDAKTAWHYYQKAFPAKNKIEQSSSLTSEETKASSNKKSQSTKLIGYRGFALLNTAIALGAGWFCEEEIKKNRVDISVFTYLLLMVQAFSRLASSNFHTIQEYERKELPSNDKVNKYSNMF